MIKSEFLKIFKSKKAWIVFIILIIIAVADSFFAIYVESNPKNYNEYVGINNPAYMSLISGSHTYTLIQIFHYLMPIFLMLAYCDTYVKERKCGVALMQCTKQGRRKYFLNKTAVAFLFPFILVGIPNLINIFINTIFLHGGTNFAGMQTWPREDMGEVIFFSINHPYTTYFIFLLMNLIVYGLLSVMCQSLCFIFKDNRIVYLLSLTIWVGIYFSSRDFAIGYILQPFVCFDFPYIIYAFLAFLPAAFISMAIAYYCVVKKKDEI